MEKRCPSKCSSKPPLAEMCQDNAEGTLSPVNSLHSSRPVRRSSGTMSLEQLQRKVNEQIINDMVKNDFFIAAPKSTKVSHAVGTESQQVVHNAAFSQTHEALMSKNIEQPKQTSNGRLFRSSACRRRWFPRLPWFRTDGKVTPDTSDVS